MLEEVIKSIPTGGEWQTASDKQLFCPPKFCAHLDKQLISGGALFTAHDHTHYTSPAGHPETLNIARKIKTPEISLGLAHPNSR